MSFYKHYESEEPISYKILLEISKKRKITEKDLINNQQHTLTSNSIWHFYKLQNILKKNKINFPIKLIDIGCGLGFLTEKIAQINGYENTFCCEPSKIAIEFIKLNFSKLNLIEGGIENIPIRYKNFFDVIHLREVYAFTRVNDFNLHKKLMEKLLFLKKENGIIIFEQINWAKRFPLAGGGIREIQNESKESFFRNLSKLNIKYEVVTALPNILVKFFLLRKILFFNQKLTNFIINLIYFLAFNKPIKNHYIMVYK